MPRYLSFKNMGQSRPLFRLFSSFSHHKLQIEKSVDGVFGIQTRGCRMVGADETTELWRPPSYLVSLQKNYYCWVEALVQWLREDTCNQKVVSLNPGAGYLMDTYHIIFLYSQLYWLIEKTKNKRKRGQGWPIKNYFRSGCFKYVNFCWIQGGVDFPGHAREGSAHWLEAEEDQLDEEAGVSSSSGGSPEKSVPIAAEFQSF